MGKFGTWFLNLGKKIGNAVIGFLKSDGVKALLRTAEAKIVQEAIDAVNAGPVKLDQHAWRAAVIERVAAKSKEAGVEFKESLVRLIIETLVAKAKAAQ